MPDATTDARGYGHFCLLAKALERVGDRWALLVVRDLLTGPKRFTDLMERMAGITPKTLTRRLRDLEGDGLVVADREVGRREVWYRLTPTGQSLQPALDELLLWGLDHLAAPPGPDEPVHPDHLIYALRAQLQREGVDVGAVSWVIRVPGTGSYTLTGDHGAWNLELGEVTNRPADVTITASRAALGSFLATAAARDPQPRDVHLAGTARSIRTMLKALTVFPRRVPAGSSDRR